MENDSIPGYDILGESDFKIRFWVAWRREDNRNRRASLYVEFNRVQVVGRVCL